MEGSSINTIEYASEQFDGNYLYYIVRYGKVPDSDFDLLSVKDEEGKEVMQELEEYELEDIYNYIQYND